MKQDVEIGKIQQSVSDFYEKHGRNFSATRRVPWGIMRLVAQDLKSGETIIDVGAGNGRLSSFLPNSVRYIAVEPSSALRDESLRYLAFRSNVEIRAGGLPQLPCKDGEADTVACFAVLHHIPGFENRRLAIHELARVLKPGGSLVLTVWNLRSVRFSKKLKNCLAAWFRMGFVHGCSSGDLMMPWRAGGADVKRYVHAYTIGELRKLFSEDIWETVRIRAWGNDAPEPVWWGRNLVVEAKKK